MAEARKATKSRKTAPAAPKGDHVDKDTQKVTPARTAATRAPNKSAGSAASKTTAKTQEKPAPTRRTKPTTEGPQKATSAPRRRVTKAAPEDPVLGAVTAAEAEKSGGGAGTEPTPEKPASKKVKMSFYAVEEIANRARAAYAHTHVYEDVVTFSEFIEQALLEKTARLEASYNAGNQWPPLAPGKVPTGRPIR
jgi:Centromere-binding protein ParB C-terminal